MLELFSSNVFQNLSQTTKRAGWVRKEIKDPESIADHMYRMGLMALIASDIPGVDRDKLGFRYFNLSCHWDTMTAFCFYFFPDSASNLISRCIKMAIVHDIAEGGYFPQTAFYVLHFFFFFFFFFFPLVKYHSF